ncbi:hypothetical protein C4K05_3841 [Pseudomonas chlororaphis subsp. aureofaciens]|uniref:Uncharacterized protein n=1 Tax=Pseudomonas chlororaphis subsp. aureofaciens TaxID=587851 RepID=A0AAD1E7Q0_9PSED|nr:hypothetical protein C4K08_3831 [Pseudomonas chlororaphis subsp. aureofaciens]AZE30545.1 hypothetical protein C4K07_3763 [Pseudomonas chlororaphis subsp. aureofaciens]AZE43178.1 hypothetical protein C4K05_3841 [Pseudomonas chlororaphis subsp. aureofaciens]
MHHAGIVTAAAGCDRRRSRRKGGFRDPAGRARRQVCGPCGTDRSLRQRLQGQRFSRMARFAGRWSLWRAGPASSRASLAPTSANDTTLL